MADNNQLVDGNNDDNIFVYTGGRAPRDVRRVKIDECIDTILARAFMDCRQLMEVEGHDKLKKIERSAFIRCRSLRRLKRMNGVKEIEQWAFCLCHALSELEFDNLEIIAAGAFINCESLRSINLPSIRRVGDSAFWDCKQLTDAKVGETLGRISNNAFAGCDILSRVDIVGGIHKTISSLHMKSWRNEMKEEINRINQTLSEIPASEKTRRIGEWIVSVLRGMDRYKVDHKVLVKEAMTLLELALWKAKLLNEEGMQCEAEEKMSQKAKIDEKGTRKEHRVTCGADIVIKNVLSFLALG